MKEQNEFHIISNSDLLEFFPAGIIVFDEEGYIKKINQTCTVNNCHKWVKQIEQSLASLIPITKI